MNENTLLIVDDDPRICRLITRIAQKIGYCVESIVDSTQFTGVIGELNPNSIFLDLNMPGADGIELLRHLSHTNYKGEITLISGSDSRVVATSERLGRDLGLDMAGMISKPVDVDQIRARLRRRFRVSSATLRDDLANDLAHAVSGDEIFTVYQPKVDLRTGKFVGAEALARWRHPEHGVMAPADFIPLAEQTGLIKPLTYKVLENTMRDSAAFIDRAPDLTISVNLSPSLLNDLSLPDRVADILGEHDFNPDRLVFEITEAGATADPVRSMDILARLRLKGMHLSIDDFGTGSSSLIQLYRLPYDEIKIDKSFVIDALNNTEAAVIVNAIIGLGHNLNLNVVAEGIENEETAAWLRERACDGGQGYYYRRPLEADDYYEWLQHR